MIVKDQMRLGQFVSTHTQTYTRILTYTLFFKKSPAHWASRAIQVKVLPFVISINWLIKDKHPDTGPAILIFHSCLTY